MNVRNFISLFVKQFSDLAMRKVRIITNWQRTEWCGSLQTFNFSAHHQELERRTDKEDPASKLRRNLLRRNWNAAASRCRRRHVVRRAAEAKPRPHKDSKVQVNSGAGRKMWKHWKAQNQSCLQICNHYTQTRSHSTMVRLLGLHTDLSPITIVMFLNSATFSNNSQQFLLDLVFIRKCFVQVRGLVSWHVDSGPAVETCHQHL